MAITNYLVHFKTEDTFTANKSQLRNDAVAFVGDATIIHTHGTDYYCGKSEVALKTDLAEKANVNHTHSASDITSGTLDISRIPTGTSASTVALGNHTHDQYLTDVDLSRYVTDSELSSAISDITPGSINAASEDHSHVTRDIIRLSGYSEGTSTTILSSTMTLNQALASLQNQIQLKASISSLNVYALKTEIPTNVSAFTNDADYAKRSEIPDISELATKSELSGYALVKHTHVVADITDFPEIPDVSNLATKSELTGYLPLSGGVLTGTLTVPNISNVENLYGINDFTIYGGPTGSGTLTFRGGRKSVVLSQSGFTYDGHEILTENNWDTYITVRDTKNTTGTSQNTSKLFLVGGTSQSSTGVITYSNSAVYTQSGQLYATRMNATSGFYETSDGTLKNIKSELNIADNIDKIPTVLFSWKKDEPEDINQDVPVHVGTIAQDIQKIYPDLVAKDAEGHLTVDYARLSVVAIAAIKELKKEIEILKSKIN